MTRLFAAAVLLLAACASGCSDPPHPITVEGGMVTVENRTDREWRNVKIVVNDHFHGGAQTLAAHGRLNGPLRDFQTGYGQRFNPVRYPVQKIELTATDSAGETVRLTWPEAPEGK